MRTITHWIGGKPVTGSTDRTSPVWNPATGEQQAEVALASVDDVDAAVRTAKAAFERWGQSSLSQRTKVLFKFRELVDANIQRLAEAISDEHGKVVSDARGEVQRGLEVIEFACGIPTLLKGGFSDQVSTGVDVYSFRQPLGVCVGMIGINVPIPVPMAYYSFGGWKDSLFGEHHIHGPEGVAFYTRGKAVTVRWPERTDEARASLDMPTAR